jgi:hypothetical protein
VGKVYFIQPTERLPNFDALEPVRTIYTNPLSVGPVKAMPGFPGISDRSEWFAIDYQGKIYIRHPGIYRFRLVSDDGAKLYIDNLNVIDNDRGLGAWTGDKAVRLSGGHLPHCSGHRRRAQGRDHRRPARLYLCRQRKPNGGADRGRIRLASRSLSHHSSIERHRLRRRRGRRPAIPASPARLSQLSAGARRYRNTTDFRDYRKFTGESTISFDH